MSESILIVDDERGIRETLSAVLRDEGFIAESVESGEACLKALAQRAFGCVLLDVWLPGINGLETLKQMRESNFDAAVVIISVMATWKRRCARPSWARSILSRSLCRSKRRC